LTETEYSIHYHVWDTEAFKAFIDECKTFLNLPIKTLEYIYNPEHHENITILKKSARA